MNLTHTIVSVWASVNEICIRKMYLIRSVQKFLNISNRLLNLCPFSHAWLSGFSSRQFWHSDFSRHVTHDGQMYFRHVNLTVRCLSSRHRQTVVIQSFCLTWFFLVVSFSIDRNARWRVSFLELQLCLWKLAFQSCACCGRKLPWCVHVESVSNESLSLNRGQHGVGICWLSSLPYLVSWISVCPAR